MAKSKEEIEAKLKRLKELPKGNPLNEYAIVTLEWVLNGKE